MNLFTMAKTVTKSIFTGPGTRMYPEKKRTYTDITRASIEIEINLCIFCGQCSRKCPTGAITVTKEQREWEINRLYCITCGACVDVCPKKCLHMNRQYSPSVTERGMAVFTAKADLPQQE